jgi:pSer/pThr/pTyr-binding forkhead associated (FHA) protein
MNVQLVVIQGQPVGKALFFTHGEYFLGRGPECHVRFNSDWVSRQHCLLRVTEAGSFLRDLGSRNGTLVNGALLAGEHPLREHDQIQIGPVIFEIRFEVFSAPVPSAPVSTGPLPSQPVPQDTTTMLPPGTRKKDEEGPPSTDSTANRPSPAPKR